MSHTKNNFLFRLSKFIVEKRTLFFLLFIFACAFSLFSANWVQVEDDITNYLPAQTETRQGVKLMDKEFTTFATAQIMISNISDERAFKIANQLKKINGVNSVEFDDSAAHLKNACALFSVTFESTENDKSTKIALDNIKKQLKNYDAYISTEIGKSITQSLENDMEIIIFIAAIIIFSVLLFTSHSYAEIPVLMITFIVAAILNKGTNFMLGKISYISNSVAVVLQLALAIDYAIILCHRFIEEQKLYPPQEAAITALSKSIIEISASSLTTISGLLALTIMHFKIGQDLSFVLIKAIFLSLLSVFTLMPGLLVLFSKYMDKTVHKNFVPKINLLGKAVIKTKYVMPPIFIVLILIGAYFSNMCPYCYSTNELSTLRKDNDQIVRDKIKSVFEKTNALALIVPAGNYKMEAKLLNEIENCEQVSETIGLSNTKAIDDYTLTDELTPREFAELVDIDYEMSKMLYSAYALENKKYGQLVNNIASFKIPLINVIEFLHDKIDENYLTLDSEMTDKINEAYDKIHRAKLQLQSKNYSRMLIKLNLPEEGADTFSFLDRLHKIIKKYYPENTYVVGNSTSDYDLSSSFSIDNILISVLSALFVIIVLIFTFMSAGLPILLIIVIQGSIWLNFSFPYLMHSKLFFLGYLIVNSIQMGANIDYAIVISNRYSKLKKQMPLDKAIIETLNQSFPTIITSGAILVSAGLLIGLISTNASISAIGICLGRGTIISIILVMGVLPQILLVGDMIIEKTKFSIEKPQIIKRTSGTVFINGKVTGYIKGLVNADIHGTIKGDVNAIVDAGNLKKLSDETMQIDNGDEKEND